MQNINVGLIGTGFMGKGHALAYQMIPKVFNPPPAIPKLAVVADINEALARRGARDFGFERWAVGWEEVIADETVDLVDITTPTDSHHVIALAAAAAGKQIYCEKPLARTAAEARLMCEAAEKAGVNTFVGFNYIKNPAALLAKAMIEEGELGEIYHFRGYFHQDVLADPNAPFTWRFDRRIAGSGALGDLGAHVIAVARFLVGEFERVCGLARTFIPERPLAGGAYGYESTALGDGSKRDVENEDCMHFLIDFRSGATGTIEASRVAMGRKVYMAYEINGSKGSLHFVHERMNELQVYLSTEAKGRHGFKTVLMGPEHPYYKSFWPVAGCGLGFGDMKIIEIYEMLDALTAHKPFYPDFHEGWKVCQIIDAVLLSVAENRWVTVDEI